MTMNNLATNLNAQNRFADSEQLFAETVELERRVFGSDNPVTLQSMSNMVRALISAAKFADAENPRPPDPRPPAPRPRPRARRHPMDHPQSRRHPACNRSREEAEKLFRETMAVRERTLGLDHPDTLGSMEELAVTLDELHRYPKLPISIKNNRRPAPRARPPTIPSPPAASTISPVMQP